MEFDDSKARTFEASSHVRYPGRNWTKPKFGELNKATVPVYENYKIHPGTTIKIFISFKARGTIAYEQTYDKKFTSAGQYDSIKEWFESEVKNLGSFGKKYTWNGLDDIGSNIDAGWNTADGWNKNSGWGWNADGSSFFVVPHRKGTSSRNISTTVKFEVIFTEGIVIFETQQKNVENNIFYETEETFDIDTNGNHVRSEQYPIIQPQNNLDPAIIELDFFNCFVQGFGVESYKYKDKFNANALGIDYRPTTASTEPYKQIRRFTDITHSSEPYNESSNINGLNNFNLATGNFKELDKQYGSIQLINNRLGDVLVLQEEKAGKVMFGKQAIYTAEGEPLVTQISEVLGQYQPYQGNNGIGLNPESFAQDNFRYYWFNTFFGTPIRLSIDGTTEINKGMETYFRNNSIAFRNSKKIGAFDTYNKLYTLSLEQNINEINIVNCGDTFQKVITESFKYILKLNNQKGNITLNYNVISGSIIAKTKFNDIEQTNTITGSGNIIVNRNTLNTDDFFIELLPTNLNVLNEIIITNLCPLPIPLDIVLVVVGNTYDNGKTILNRFKTNLNAFLEYEDTFTDSLITKFQTLNGFEGQGLFPVNGDTVTIQSVKRQLHTGSFKKTGENNKIKYLISNTNYQISNIQDLLNNSVNLNTTETVQGINQNTFTSSFQFNRTTLDQKLYIIWDYRDSFVPAWVVDQPYCITE